MSRKRMTIFILCVAIILSSVGGSIYWMFHMRQLNASQAFNTEGNSINKDNIENIGALLPMLYKENEVYLDPNLIARLEQMQRGYPALDEEGNYMLHPNGEIVYEGGDPETADEIRLRLLLLVNRFAQKKYSVIANQQVQRLYFEYHERFVNEDFEVLCDKLAKCIPVGGIDQDELVQKASEVFGFYRGDEFSFVFVPTPIAVNKVRFCEVKPHDIELDTVAKSFCIYEDEKSEDESEYERNLEGWLFQMIAATQDAKLSNNHVYLAQLLYLGSLADAKYRSDWKNCLLECLSLKEMNYDDLKLAVMERFGVCIDNNTPLRTYFKTLNMEMIE